MRNLLLIICLFSWGTGFTQTLEETSDWLKQNQEQLLPALSCEHINGNETASFNLEIKNDSLVYTIDYNGKAIWTLALKDLVYQDVKAIAISGEPYYDACSDLIYFILQSAPDKIMYYRQGLTGVEIKETDSILSIVFNKNKKSEALQVLKNLMHLAELKKRVRE